MIFGEVNMDITLEDAIALIEEKKFLEAKSILTDLLKDDDTNSEIWRYAGLCNVNLKMYKQAFLDFSKAVEINPNDAVAWYYFGNMADKLKNYELAETA